VIPAYAGVDLITGRAHSILRSDPRVCGGGPASRTTPLYSQA